MKKLIDQFTHVDPQYLETLRSRLRPKGDLLEKNLHCRWIYSHQGRTVVSPPPPDDHLPAKVQFLCATVGQITLEVIRQTPATPATSLVRPQDLALITLRVIRGSNPSDNPPLSLLVPFSDPLFSWSGCLISLEAAYLGPLGEIYEAYLNSPLEQPAWIQTDLLEQLKGVAHENEG